MKKTALFVGMCFALTLSASVARAGDGETMLALYDGVDLAWVGWTGAVAVPYRAHEADLAEMTVADASAATAPAMEVPAPVAAEAPAAPQRVEGRYDCGAGVALRVSVSVRGMAASDVAFRTDEGASCLVTTGAGPEPERVRTGVIRVSEQVYAVGSVGVTAPQGRRVFMVAGEQTVEL